MCTHTLCANIVGYICFIRSSAAFDQQPNQCVVYAAQLALPAVIPRPPETNRSGTAGDANGGGSLVVELQAEMRCTCLGVKGSVSQVEDITPAKARPFIGSSAEDGGLMETANVETAGDQRGLLAILSAEKQKCHNVAPPPPVKTDKGENTFLCFS